MDEPSHQTPDLTASLENYIETIYLLEKETRVARVKDIARKMDVKMSTVTSALKRLSELKMVHYDPYSVITLTSEGKKVAKRLSRRHKALANFFEKVLFVDADIAQESAIRVEHVIDEELFSRFVAFADFLESCPKVGIMWQEDRGFSCAKYGKENLCGCACPVPSGHDVPEEKHIKVRVGLDAMPVGTGGKIKRLPLDITVREMCVQAGFSAGSYLTVTARDKNACTVTVQINNSEKTISADDAAHIIIKPSAIPLRLLGEGSKAVIRYVAEPVAEELAAIGVMPNAECAVSAIHSDTETIDVVLNDSQAALSFTQAEKIQVIPFA